MICDECGEECETFSEQHTEVDDAYGIRKVVYYTVTYSDCCHAKLFESDYSTTPLL